MIQNSPWKEALLKQFLRVKKVCTDTRTLEKGAIFFALKGPNFNGNKYAESAVEIGASLVVVDEIEYSDSKNILLVNDSLEALQWLANEYRNLLKGRVLAIGGSNGKTTSKGLVSKVLSQEYSTFSTPGNFNNHIGLPLSILSCPMEAEMVILELGANHLGEHTQLLKIARPDDILITNIGKDHLEGFGGIEGVVSATKEFFDYANKNGVRVFYGADQKEFEGISSGGISFGQNPQSNYPAELVREESGKIQVKIENPLQIFKSNLFGDYNFGNILSSIVIGRVNSVPDDQIQKGLFEFHPEKNRSQVLDQSGLKIFLDCYNANPTSMEASILSFFKNFEAPYSLLLGGMKELGDYSIREHELIFALAKKHTPGHIILCGEEFSFASKERGVSYFGGFKELQKHWESLRPRTGSLLVKGSRSYNLEKLFE